MHIDVVDAIERQCGHGDVPVYAHELFHDAVDPTGIAYRLVEFALRAILVQHQLGAEGRAGTVAHEVTAGMYQVVRRGGGADDRYAFGRANSIAQLIVRWSWAVVDPVQQQQRVHLVGVDAFGKVVARPDAVERCVEVGDARDIFNGTPKVRFSQKALDVCLVIAHDDDTALWQGVPHDLLEDARKSGPYDHQAFHLLPFGHGTHRERWWAGGAPTQLGTRGAVWCDQVTLVRGHRVRQCSLGDQHRGRQCKARTPQAKHLDRKGPTAPH